MADFSPLEFVVVFLLFAALAGLFVGPLLFAVLHRDGAPQLALDGFVLVAVVGLVMLNVIPEAFEVAGAWALLAAGIGVLIPLAAEKVQALSHRTSHGVVLALAFSGLFLHASLDGVGLGGSEGLALAVVLHQIPVGLAVWWLVRPQFGRGWAFAVLGGQAAATVAGYVLQMQLVEPGGIVWVQLVQALVAGSLLHVVMHQAVGLHVHKPGPGRWHVPGAIGAVLGALLVGALPDAHHHAFGERIVEAALVVSPVVLIAYVLACGWRRRMDYRLLDKVAPWSVALIVFAALVTHTHADAGPLNVLAAIALAGLTLLSLVRRGPRDFLLVVLPLDLLGGAHDHDADGEEHNHAGHDAAHGATGHGHDDDHALPVMP